jgi:hypothetical protein
MTRTIWKYPLKVEHQQAIRVSAHTIPLHVGVDPLGQPCLWAMVEPDGPEQDVEVLMYGTGWEIPDSFGTYLGTVVVGSFVWHYYLGQRL